MSLDAVLLERLAEWRPESGRQTLAAADEASGWSAAVTADAADQVGSRLWEVTLRHAPALARDADGLKDWGTRVAGRATGLLEPLRLLEVDAPRGVALLRSETPGQRGDDRFYYEVLLHADGTAEARRYQAPGEGEPRRQQVAFTLTHEVLAKFVADLTYSV
jgi:hypothetical protein